MGAHRETLTDDLRQRIVEGEFAPGARLSESTVAKLLGVSRNTLRESFRVLAEQGLIEHTPNRGASVAAPTIADVIDIYRARRYIEPEALGQGSPLHPAAAQMQAAIDRGRERAKHTDWHGVGTANMDFHAGIVALADSPRLTRLFRDVAAELRLAFLEIDNPRQLHAPFLDRNQALLALFVEQGGAAAAQELERYLVYSEQAVLGTFIRLGRA
mgnify:CR=1 FL=1